MTNSKKSKNKDTIVSPEKLGGTIEDMELDEMSESDITRAVSAFSSEGMRLRAERKKTRYQLYRLRTEAEGLGASASDAEFAQVFESQEGFRGWRQFAVLWDVAMDDPTRVVSRDLSEQEEWNNVVTSKFPQIRSDGRIVYPDLKVKARVDADAAKRKGVS
jgi:hypothetical protein